MDILEVEVSGDLPFLQAHLRQVIQTDLRFRGSFGFAVEGHCLRQEVRKVRQVGVEVQREVKQHVAHKVGQLRIEN